MASLFETNWVSDYILHDQINYTPDRTLNKTLSKLQVIDKYDEGVVTISDMYILYIVHVMTFANAYQVWEYVKWWGKHNNEIPLISSDNFENFKNRLEELCKNSFLKRHKFKNVENKSRDYFYVTVHGYNFLKKKLYYTGPYDEYLGAIPLQEVLKYLANNEILIEILKKTTVEHGYHLESKPVFVSHIQFFDKAARENVTTFGFFNIRKPEGKIKILLEPYRPTFDKHQYQQNQMVAIQENRFAFIKRYFDEYVKKNNTPNGLNIVFVAESLEAAKKLAGIIATFDPYLRGIIYITVDKLVKQHGLDKTFLKVIDRDGKINLSPVLLEV